MRPCDVRLCVGCISREVVEAVVGLRDLRIALIPTHHQVSHAPGYTGMTTRALLDQAGPVPVVRDHQRYDMGLITYDIEDGLRAWHLDPWESAMPLDLGIRQTIAMAEALPARAWVEGGTEDGIRQFSLDEIKTLANVPILDVVVVQAGTKVWNGSQAYDGGPDIRRVESQAGAVRKAGKLSKAHACDYLDVSAIRSLYGAGVDMVNIAPELGTIQTEVIVNRQEDVARHLLSKIVSCGSALRWTSSDDPKTLLRVAGHYHITDVEVSEECRREAVDRIQARISELLLCL